MQKQTALGRGFEVLAVVCELAPTTVEAVAANLGLPLSTAYRYVRTLRELGFIQEYEGYYDVGVRMLGLVRDVFTKELAPTGIIHIGGPGEAHSLFSTVAHLVKAPRDAVTAPTSKEPGR